MTVDMEFLNVPEFFNQLIFLFLSFEDNLNDLYSLTDEFYLNEGLTEQCY